MRLRGSVLAASVVWVTLLAPVAMAEEEPPRGTVPEAPVPPAATLPAAFSGSAAQSSLSGAYLAARHAGSQQDLAASAGFYRNALMRDPDNLGLRDYAVRLHVASGSIARAAEMAPQLLEADPQNQAALMAQIVHAVRTGDTALAREATDALKPLDGPLQRLISGLVDGWVTKAEGRPASAINAFDDVRGPDWYNGFLAFHAGLAADTSGLHTIAGDRLFTAYGRDQGAVRVATAYARHLARSGQTEKALEVLTNFEEVAGGLLHFTEDLRAEIESGEVQPLISDAREGLAEALYGVGSALGRDGSEMLSTGLFQLALHLVPDSYFPAVALGSNFERLDQHEAAIDVYRGVSDASPLKRSAQIQEALNLSALERNEEAIALLEELVAQDPDDTATAIALGNVHRVTENFEAARDVYGATIDRLGEVPAAYWTLYYYRGIAHERIGQWDEAQADFRAALEMEVDQPLVLNYLGYSYIDRGENLDEALDMVRKAVEQRPQDGYIVDSLGWAYYRLGRYEEAVEQLEKAVELRPRDAVINDHLGDAYWKVGRKLEATFQWTHARNGDPEPDLLVIIEDKLENGLSDEDDGTQAAAAAETAPATETVE